MKKWQHFEQLVAAIHRFLDKSGLGVETDIVFTERYGATHQIDVVVGRNATTGPTLISCKAWSNPVGVSHIREWSDVVHHTGAASGVVVAESGFTANAIASARNPARHISLWIPRILTDTDFAPDDKSPSGYIAAVVVSGCVTEPSLVEGSFRLDTAPAEGPPQGKELPFTFSFTTRDQWCLLDERDAVVGNLWDEFVKTALSATTTTSLSYIPPRPAYLVFDGHRLLLRSMSFDVLVTETHSSVEVDLRQQAFGYENVLTREIHYVPVPSLSRSKWRPKGFRSR